MEKKYELTDIKIEVFDKTLFRIRALRDIEKFEIKKGDLGGYIEKEENLSQDDNAWVCGNAWVYGDARVCGDARVSGDAWVYGDAWVSDNADVMWLSNIGSRLGTTTAFRTKDGGIEVRCGCFYGSLNEFAAKVSKTHGDNKYGREYKAAIEFIKIHFGEEEQTNE